MKQIVKYFNLLAERTLFKLKNKTNYFFNKKTKVKYFNKFLISSIFLLFLYLFYLSVPTLYEKTWVQNTIEDKLTKDFKIDFSISADINYRILPSPHFLIKDVKIFRDNKGKKKELAEIKNLKVFISLKNFFNKEKIKIKKVAIHDANFSLQAEDLIFLNEISHNKFSNKKIKILNGNFFFKDDKNETLAIAKLNFGSLFYDELKMLNSFDIRGEIFNIPFDFYLKKNFSESNIKEINFKAKTLKLNINDKLEKKTNGSTHGINLISFFNINTSTKYNINENTISFDSDQSQVKNLNIDYKGKLSFRPFEFDLKIDLRRYNLLKLIDLDSIIGEVFKSKLLFNENLTSNISINIGENINNKIFKSSIIHFNILNGKINFDQTTMFNDKIGLLKIINSNLFFEENNLILKSDIIIDIQNSDNLFSFFKTPKETRKPIKNILIDFDYDLLKNQININSVSIDGEVNNNEMLDIVKEISNIEKYNLNKAQRIFNKILSAYAG